MWQKALTTGACPRSTNSSENYDEVLGTKLVDLGLEHIGKGSRLYYLDSDGSIKCFCLANGVIFSPENKSGMYLRPFATLMFTE